MRRFALGWIALLLGFRAGLALAQGASAEKPAWEYDPENARAVLETCAGCHGRNGEGGKGGTYPRLAGLRQEYIAKQLRAFKRRERINVPMYPYATERELPESDVRDIARLLSQIELPSEMPAQDAQMTALERLRAAQAVFDVPRAEGDVARGAELYEDACGECHGPKGFGEDDAPPLAGQYTEYLRRQIASFRSGERLNEDMKDVFEELDAADLQDIFAYLSEQD